MRDEPLGPEIACAEIPRQDRRKCCSVFALNSSAEAVRDSGGNVYTARASGYWRILNPKEPWVSGRRVCFGAAGALAGIPRIPDQIGGSPSLITRNSGIPEFPFKPI